MTRFTPLMLFLGLALLLAFLLLTQVDRRAIHASTEPQPLPALSLQPLDSKHPWDQAALLGQVTVINIFASWCTPCAAEMPELVALKKQFPDVRVIGVVWNDDPKTIRAFLKQHGNPFEALWLDPKGNATIALGIKGIPETLVVDARGTIRYRLPGILTQNLRTGEVATLLTELQQEAADAR